MAQLPQFQNDNKDLQLMQNKWAAVLNPIIKQAEQEIVISRPSGTFTSTSSTYVDVTNLNVTFTSTGRPVMLMLIPDATKTFSYISINTSSSGSAAGSFRFVRDDISLGIHDLLSSVTTLVLMPVGSVLMVDMPAAGVHTYKLQARKTTGTGNSIEIEHAKLVAYEL